MRRCVVPEVKPILLSDQVAAAIKEVILSGDLKPGDRITEEEFAARLKVSRIPLREALKQLELLGIVRREPNRGTFVAELTWEEIKEIFAIRNLLEGMAVKLAAERANAEDIAKMQKLIDEMRLAVKRRDLTGLVLADIDFHQAVWEASKSKVLKRQLSALLMPYFVYIASIGYVAQHEVIGSVVDSHEAIFDRIARKNPRQAERCLLRMNAAYLKSLDGYVSRKR